MKRNDPAFKEELASLLAFLEIKTGLHIVRDGHGYGLGRSGNPRDDAEERFLAEFISESNDMAGDTVGVAWPKERIH